MKISDLIKDIATIIVFFLLALLPTEVEAYANEGHFIINANIVYMSGSLAILIFIVGKTLAYLRTIEIPREEIIVKPKPIETTPISYKICVLILMFSILALLAGASYEKPFYAEHTVTIIEANYHPKLNTTRIVYSMSNNIRYATLIFDRIDPIELFANHTYRIRHTNGEMWRVTQISEIN